MQSTSHGALAEQFGQYPREDNQYDKGVQRSSGDKNRGTRRREKRVEERRIPEVIPCPLINRKSHHQGG